jgi:hypothetical protein
MRRNIALFQQGMTRRVDVNDRACGVEQEHRGCKPIERVG